MHVTELGIEHVLILLVPCYSLYHFVQDICLRYEDASRRFFTVEIGLRIDVLIMCKTFKPSYSFLRIRFVGIGPTDHIKTCYLVFCV